MGCLFSDFSKDDGYFIVSSDPVTVHCLTLGFYRYCIHKKLKTLSLCSHIKIPREVSVIKPKSFFDYERLESIVLPESLIVIQSEAFAYCNNLRYVYIPDSVLFIGYRAFATSGLIAISYPATVRANTSYLSCKRLDYVYERYTSNVYVYSARQYDANNFCVPVNTVNTNGVALFDSFVLSMAKLCIDDCVSVGIDHILPFLTI